MNKEQINVVMEWLKNYATSFMIEQNIAKDEKSPVFSYIGPDEETIVIYATAGARFRHLTAKIVITFLDESKATIPTVSPAPKSNVIIIHTEQWKDSELIFKMEKDFPVPMHIVPGSSTSTNISDYLAISAEELFEHLLKNTQEDSSIDAGLTFF